MAKMEIDCIQSSIGLIRSLKEFDQPVKITQVNMYSFRYKIMYQVINFSFMVSFAISIKLSNST